jgi:hypothetical protein
MDPTQWLELFRLFTHVEEVSFTSSLLLPSIMQALGAEDMSTEMLPELTSLEVPTWSLSDSDSESVKIAAKQFVARRMSSGGRTVKLTGLE